MNRDALSKLDKDALLDLIEHQAALLDRFEARVAELERAGVRGAAPFARPAAKRSTAPKKPGRGKGHEGSFRVAPSEDEIDRRIDVPLDVCPHCGSPLDPETDEAVQQTVLELPPVAPEAIRLVTHKNRCGCCALPVRSTHPLQLSQASGAASTFLGPRALGLAVSLNKGFGLSMRKTCAVMKASFGLQLSAGGLSQALARVARRLKPDYDALYERLHNAPVLHTDETSWYVGKPGFSLWVVTGREGTYYRVVASRSGEAARDLLGGYKGVLVSDCLNIYDNLTPVQQKCYAHHLKEISKAQELMGGCSQWLHDLKGVLKAAMALKQITPELSPPQVVQMRLNLEHNADRLLVAPRDGPEERVRKRVVKQRDHLFTFLDHEECDATNNLAEQQLRPAVISRKISCGNKTEQGARTWEVLTSLTATCSQTGTSFVDYLTESLQNRPAFIPR